MQGDGTDDRITNPRVGAEDEKRSSVLQGDDLGVESIRYTTRPPDQIQLG